MSKPRIVIILIFFIGTCIGLINQSSHPEDPPNTSQSHPNIPAEFVAGYNTGLYRLTAKSAKAEHLWDKGQVYSIIRTATGWFLITSKGIIFSADLKSFEDRSKGIATTTIKRIEGSKKLLVTTTKQIKALAIDPENAEVLAACTNDAIYTSINSGQNWQSIGTPESTSGYKAIAIGYKEKTKGIWLSHSIKGVFFYSLTAPTTWVPSSEGLEVLPGTNNIEEVTSLVTDSNATIWAANTFLPRIYRYDQSTQHFVIHWAGKDDFKAIESLDWLSDTSLRFVADGAIQKLQNLKLTIDISTMSYVQKAVEANLNSQLLSLSWQENSRQYSLAELWNVIPPPLNQRKAKADKKQGIYINSSHILTRASIKKFDTLLSEKNVNSIVLDVKDDQGRIRYNTLNPEITKISGVFNPVDIDFLIKEWKAKGRYLIARIPVFKDKFAFNYNKKRFAIWDKRNNTAWRPARTTPDDGDLWVDPYSEEVWQYNVAIAQDVVARGFDEVQFDYIRFPTDGSNLGTMSFRWQEKDMTRETAILSFLIFARERLQVPISLDIYGANGWYRSAARTGQDIELMSQYVDVICPMFYPSHFEQNFQNQNPAVERPYRIYKLGTQRSLHISRKYVVIRPYAQAFFLNVPYDKAYYGPTYVELQVRGVQDGADSGLTFWNNSGRYQVIPTLLKNPRIDKSPKPLTDVKENQRETTPTNLD